MIRTRHLVLALCALLAACAARDTAPSEPASRITTIPASTQRPGDPDAGRDFLLYGDYIGGGIPYDLWRALMGIRTEPDPFVPREGKAGTVPHTFNAFTDERGAEIVAGVNCLACHASRFGDTYIIGLGNSFSDWTPSDPFPEFALNAAAVLAYPDPHSPERVSMARFMRGVRAIGNDADTPFRGVNPAFRVEELAGSHRDPRTLEWSDQPLFEISDIALATDVPPWWHVKKKHGLYYNGMGRGDFAKLIQQITVVAIEDEHAAQRIHAGMTDLLAYLRTIEAPEWPRGIDRDLARTGRTVFENNCASCHGTYGDGFNDPNWTYPNKVVPVEIVGTDPVYAQTLMEPRLTAWYNESWFAVTEPTSRVEPTLGYIAPPLDGVWISAPYLHNGSVPTLEALLDSSKRPTWWRRSFDPNDYDYARVGWNYEELDGPRPGDINVYDTTIESYGNMGHTFGDDLTDEERAAVIEYLKTL
ncbi:MAG: hypothetical protein Tsb0013_13700 [Phycisphaerales bacterium]